MPPNPWDQVIEFLPLNSIETEFLKRNRDEILCILFPELKPDERLVLTHLYGVVTPALTIQEVWVNYAPTHQTGPHTGKRQSAEWVHQNRRRGERKLSELLRTYFYERRSRLSVQVQIQYLRNNSHPFLAWYSTPEEMRGVARLINWKPTKMSVIQRSCGGDAWVTHPQGESSTEKSHLLTVQDIVDELIPLLEGMSQSDVPPIIQKIVDTLTRYDLRIH